MRLSGAAPGVRDVVIIDIDEEALSVYGRWPWSRSVLAKLVGALDAAGARAIGFDMVFSDEDRLENATADRQFAESVLKSFPTLPPKDPKRGDAKWGPVRSWAENLRGNLESLKRRQSADEEFANALSMRGGVAIGMFLHNDAMAPDPSPEQRAILRTAAICKDSGRAAAYLARFSKVTASLPIFLRSGVALGSFNFVPDTDGTGRSGPLLVSYESEIFPSLSLAVLSKALGETPECVTQLGLLSGVRIGGRTIPVDQRGHAFLRYYGPGNSFSYYGVHQVLTGKVGADALRNRIALVGTSAPGLFDLRVTPMDDKMPGVEIHATAIQNMIDGRFMRRPTFAGLVDLTVLLILGLCLTTLLPRLNAVQGAILAFGLVGAWTAIDMAVLFPRGYWFHLFFPWLLTLTLYMGFTALNYLRAEMRVRQERAKRAELKSAFQHYVSGSLVEQILQNPERLRLGGERRELTVLFSDVRGFTTLSERLTPEALVDLLNEYLTPMTEIVLNEKGMLDKYIGDAIMAVWGAPLPLEQHARHACQAAVAMRDRLFELHTRWKERSIPALEIGIGINTGEMSIGNMGSAQRFDYTVMGDSVNLSARLEGVNKVYGTRILVSEFTVREAGSGFLFRELDRLRVKGKSNAVSIFELMGLVSQSPANATEIIERFAQALLHYRNQDWEAAIKAFERVLMLDPNDGPSRMFLERITVFQQRSPEAQWDGVFEMKSK